MSDNTSTEIKVTLAKMTNVNTARELGFTALYTHGVTLLTGQLDRIAMARANVVIVAWESGEWRDVRSPADDTKPAFADWAAFCRQGLGISTESQISGDARKHIVRTLRDRDVHKAEINDLAVASGANVRTINRDIAALGADAEKQAAGKDAQTGAGNTGDGTATTQTADMPKFIATNKGVKSVDLAVIVDYLTTQVDVAELARLFGAEFVNKLHAAVTTPDVRDAA